MSRYASFRAVFITSYRILLYFCFIVKKEAIRKELKFYDHSLSIAVYDTIVISNKKRKRENLYIDIISNNPFDSPQMIQKRSYSKFLRWKIILEILESEIYDISPVCIYTASARSRQGRDNWFAPSHSEHSHDCDWADLHGRGMWRERLSFRSRLLQTGAANHDRPWGRLISRRRTPHRNGSASIAGKHAIYTLSLPIPCNLSPSSSSLLPPLRATRMIKCSDDKMRFDQ